ncbi:MAG TPA: hypothetical protein VMV94_05545 [Phycisphaerae bacterium]|nr:hypothetical protein [Phycisphaerae bacterium]
MKSFFRALLSVRFVALNAAMVLAALATGCSPYSTIANLGIKVVGDAVNDADVSQKSQQLVGQPVAAADAEFGPRIRTLEEVQTGRTLITYPVKGDLLKMYHWAVEARKDRIVALSKLQNDPDGGKDLAEKLVLKEIVIGKTPQQLQSHDFFKKLVLTLRDRSSGDTLRVYDTSLIPSFMGAKYCVLEFDGSSTCQSVNIVGVPASSPGSALGQ